ncbi:MAG: hypothetical protein GKR88_04210 [Flavobacteriaceae bacterium]|nr:MAG: hypothetical protein GKR88_04210 [Flavobacteriaceae bacterium]
MKITINKTVNLNLKGFKGKSSTLLQLFSDVAKKEGWSEREIYLVKAEALRLLDYDHLLETIKSYCKE